jgi:hypothetical protein
MPASAFATTSAKRGLLTAINSLPAQWRSATFLPNLLGADQRAWACAAIASRDYIRQSSMKGK